MTLRVPIPVLLTKEGTWFVASCPILDIVTQEKTEREIKENLANLIDEYLPQPLVLRAERFPFEQRGFLTPSVCTFENLTSQPCYASITPGKLIGFQSILLKP